MQVRPVTHADLPALLAPIADPQRFYGNTAPDDEHNAAFFGAFVAPSERGMLICAYEEDGSVAGYTCLYWTADDKRAMRRHDLIGGGDRAGPAAPAGMDLVEVRDQLREQLAARRLVAAREAEPQAHAAIVAHRHGTRLV